MADKKNTTTGKKAVTPKNYDRWGKVGFEVVSKPKQRVKKGK